MEMKIIHKILFSALASTFASVVLVIFASVMFSRGMLVNVVDSYNGWLAKAQGESIDRIIYRRLERWESYSGGNKDLKSFLKSSNSVFTEQSDTEKIVNEKYAAWKDIWNDPTNDFVRSLVENNIATGLRDQGDFYEKKQGYSIFPEFAVTNAYGLAVAMNRSFPDSSFEDREWWQQARDRGLFVGDIRYDEFIGAYGLDLGVGIRDEQNHFLGVLWVFYDMRDLFEVMDEIKQDSADFRQMKDSKWKEPDVFLLDSQGRLIYSTQNGFGNLSDKKEYLYLIQNGETKNNSVLSTDENGKKILMSHTHLSGYKDFEGLEWTLFITRETGDVYNLINSTLFILSIIGGACLFLSSCLAIILSSYIARPIRRLSQDAALIQRGNWDYSVAQLDSKDEIGELSRSFNAMISAIKESRKNVDQKVKEQTRETVKKSKALEEKQTALLNVLEDIEEEKDRSYRLAKDLEKFKLAVENASDHIVITDKDGMILYANKAVKRITGFMIEEIMGKKAGSKNLWGGQMGQDFYVLMWRTLKEEKKAFVGELRNRRKNGEEYTALASISPVLDNGGEVVFFVGIERDITQEKEVDKAKTEFVSLASHQLRTPLSAINWYAEMLLSGDAGELNEEQKSFVKEIYGGNRRMVALVNALLNVSRIELGTLAIDPKPTDLSEIAESVLHELESQISEKELSVERRFDADLPLINADPNIARIIFQNLLTNSVKYTPKGGAITVSIEKTDDIVCIKVSDTGCGIPENQQQRIYEKMFRADNAKKADAGGNGLGLYLVKAIVRDSGGTIQFTSKENMGTTFSITLPLSGMKKKEGLKTLEEEKV